MTKRKVTDLLPSEAILISSDADLKVLDEFEKVGIVWHSSRRKPTEYYPKQFPFYVRYDLSFDGIVLKFYPTDYEIIPATDFIPTESERIVIGETNIDWDLKGKALKKELDEIESDEVSDTKKDWYIKLLAKLKRIESGELLLSEYIEQVEIKTRNTRTNERN